MNLLELFAGIGGFRLGFELAQIEVKQKNSIAIDINEKAASVYQSNWKNDSNYVIKDISSLPVEWFINANCDTWTMSPPCQPYSVQGNQKDDLDNRASPLLHITSILEQMPCDKLPKIIIIENVAPFEQSNSWQVLRKVLNNLNYSIKTHLISPDSIGLPHKRSRFFVWAELGAPKCSENTRVWPAINPSLNSIEELLDSENDPELLLSLEHRRKQQSCCWDICTKRSIPAGNKVAACFTKAYGRYDNGTGSMWAYCNCGESNDGDELIKPLDEILVSEDWNIRRFSPMEVARLLGFPKTFSFPNNCCRRTQWSLLGNSLSPAVVAKLIVYSQFPKCSVILSNISKKHNYGSIIRAACAFGITDFFVVGGYKLRTWGNKGTRKFAKFHVWDNLSKMKQFLNQNDVTICGIEIASHAQELSTITFDKRVAFLLGNEGQGMSKKELALCDRLVYIAQYSQATASLNVAQAGAIVFHHWAKQQSFKETKSDNHKFSVDKEYTRSNNLQNDPLSEAK